MILAYKILYAHRIDGEILDSCGFDVIVNCPTEPPTDTCEFDQKNNSAAHCSMDVSTTTFSTTFTTENATNGFERILTTLQNRQKEFVSIGLLTRKEGDKYDFISQNKTTIFERLKVELESFTE